MMSDVKPLYLTCTASQAQEFNATNCHGFLSLNELLEARAESHSDVCVAGFPEQTSDTPGWTVLKFTYSSLLSASNQVAVHYKVKTSLCGRTPEEKGDRIIALLCPSCADFLVTLFAALRLGYGVLLIAPQNTNEAIAYLCGVTSATHLICHESLLEQGRHALQANSNVTIVQMASRNMWQGVECAKPLIKPILSPSEEADMTALVMHTSGSTGMPKPIYHPHRIWTEAIPCMPWKPAFTTTPLFHGGSCDILRSLNALSTLYLFPSTLPMTAANVVNAVSACHDTAAFLSVPYILKMLAEDGEGLKMLQRMELVSVGGAPLPEQMGDRMVQQGIKLVSRLGSSECGFLMSSHRDYGTDTDWSWLRNNGLGVKMLRFEPADDSESMFELVVDKAWSTRVVSNREDGSFATGDLYAKHPTLPHTWRYCGRADDVIVMMNGKKASANAIETKLRASPDISEAIVFGASKPMLGVLIIPAHTNTARDELLLRVHEANVSGATYASIIDDMVIYLPYDAKLPKTSKGSIIRPQALKMYAQTIEDAYRQFEQGSPKTGRDSVVAGGDVTGFVRQLVSDAVQTRANGGRLAKFDDDDDLFALGLTSLHAVQIRGYLQKIVASDGHVLGNNVVFEYPSVRKLSQHIMDVRAGRGDKTDSDEQQYNLMRSLLARYGQLDDVPINPATTTDSNSEGVAVLTGATGALGAHILAELVTRTRLHVIALVRATDDEDAIQRLSENLKDRKLNTIDNARYSAAASTLSEERLGLSEALYKTLLAESVIIIHAAWPVNFAYNLESFSPVLKGTQSLLRLAASTERHAKIIFCSSIATVSNSIESSSQKVPERLPHSVESTAPMGYAQAKWVAEHMCNQASRTPTLRGRVAIARIGQLCGDTKNGIWNEKEGWPLLIATSRYTGCLPMLDERVSWLPLDVAAQATVDIALSGFEIQKQSQECPVYHVMNPANVSWLTLLGYFEQSGLTYDRVQPSIWLERVRGIQDPHGLPFRNLHGLWERNYGATSTTKMTHEHEFETAHARAISRSLRDVSDISFELVQKMLGRWQEIGFLPAWSR